jgi:hypothetical protein
MNDISVNSPERDYLERLGLNVDLIKSLPKDRIIPFLRAYEKLIRITHHPDQYSETEKARHEAISKNIGEAVEGLVSNPFNLDMVLHDSQKGRTETFQLRKQIENQIARIEKLEEMLKGQQQLPPANYLSLMREYNNQRVLEESPPLINASCGLEIYPVSMSNKNGNLLRNLANNEWDLTAEQIKTNAVSGVRKIQCTKRRFLEVDNDKHQLKGDKILGSMSMPAMKSYLINKLFNEDFSIAYLKDIEVFQENRDRLNDVWNSGSGLLFRYEAKTQERVDDIEKTLAPFLDIHLLDKSLIFALSQKTRKAGEYVISSYYVDKVI